VLEQGPLTSGTIWHAASLDEPLSAEIVNTGNWVIDVAGERIKATASLRPLYDPNMERIKC